MNEFSRAYQDFTDHYVEIDEDEIKVYEKAAEQFWKDIELLAATYQVPCDYIIEEFILD